MHPCYDPTITLDYDDLSWANTNNLNYLPPSSVKNVKDQLTYLSWPPSENQAPNRFIFDDTAGDGVTVYILDTGANLGKDVSSLSVLHLHCCLSLTHYV